MADQKSDDLREIPGSYGLPLVGLLLQSLSFFKDLLGFCTARRERYGSTVFKASPGIASIVLLEQESLDTLFDTRLCSKPYGFGGLRPDPQRVGHIRPTICSNDAAHDGQKRFVLHLIARRTPHLVPTLDEVATPYFERWAAAGAFDWDTGIDTLMADFVFQWAVGARLNAADVEEWAYSTLVVGPLWLPRPGTAKKVAALHRLLAALQAAPEFPAAAAEAAETAGLDADAAAKQLLFTLAFNAWGGLQGVTRSVIAELFLHPQWADRAAAEVREALPGGAEPTLQTIAEIPTVGWIVRETMRLHTPVQSVYGIAREDLVVSSSTGSYAVRKGELMQGILAWANRNPNAFDNPEVFDPQRFDTAEAHRNLVWPAGRGEETITATGHTCAGRDVVYQVMTLFLAKLLRYRFTLSEKPDWGTGFSAASRPLTPLRCTSFTPRGDG